MTRFVSFTCILTLLSLSSEGVGLTKDKEEALTNFVIIFVDDLGYGDIGPFGSRINETPELDRMAAEGMKLTSFYSASAVCTPSRAALMTGCYPLRVGLPRGSGHAVLFPGDPWGLHPDEITIPEILKKVGYRSGCFGKWHLGDQPGFLPTDQGFDSYYGIPYSNDMWPGLIRWDFPDLPILRNDRVIDLVKDMKDQGTLCRKFTEEAVTFIHGNRDKPFFVYLEPVPKNRISESPPGRRLPPLNNQTFRAQFFSFRSFAPCHANG